MLPAGAKADFFYPLSPRLTMLLTTIFTQGGADDLPLVDLLPESESQILKEKAQTLLELDGDKRVGTVVREMRRQVQFAGLVGLEALDPSWLLAAVRGEQPLAIAIILAQLSASVRSRILSLLPSAVRARVPAKEDLRNVPLEVMRIVRQKFESRFEVMRMPLGAVQQFYFRDLSTLEGRELTRLVRALGIEELGSAFLTIGKRKLAELCHKLGRESAAELLAAVRETDLQDAMDVGEANVLLTRILAGLKLGEAQKLSRRELEDRFQRALFQKAGLFRLAKAVRAERPAFAQQLAQRLPRNDGRVFLSYVYRINETNEVDDTKLCRLQDLVLLRVHKLAERGLINPGLLEFTFQYHSERPPTPGSASYDAGEHDDHEG